MQEFDTVWKCEQWRLTRRTALLDGAITVMGFGFCRAWLVFCLTFPAVAGTGGINWAFLLLGAVAGFAVAVVASRSRAFPAKAMRRATTCFVAASSVLMPLAAMCGSPVALVAGVASGGVGASLLQICWGHPFAEHGRGFALVCTPAAAIATGAVLAVASPEQSALIMAALPLASLGLLVVRTSASERAVCEVDGHAADGAARAACEGEACVGDGAVAGAGGVAAGEAMDERRARATGGRGAAEGVADGVARASAVRAAAGATAACASADGAADGRACEGAAFGAPDARGRACEGTERSGVTTRAATPDDEAACGQKRGLRSRLRMRLYRAACDRGGGRLMLSICVFSFLVRVFDAVPSDGADPFSQIGGSGAFALLFVGVLFLAITRIFRSATASLLVYRLSCPIMATGMVAVALAFDVHSALSVAVLSLGYELFDLLAWVLFSEYARERGRSGFAVFGAGTGFMLLGMGGGYACGQVAVACGVANDALGMTYLALGSMACLFVVAFLIVPENVVGALRKGALGMTDGGAVRAAVEGDGAGSAVAGEGCCATEVEGSVRDVRGAAGCSGCGSRGVAARSGDGVHGACDAHAVAARSGGDSHDAPDVAARSGCGSHDAPGSRAAVAHERGVGEVAGGGAAAAVGRAGDLAPIPPRDGAEALRQVQEGAADVRGMRHATVRDGIESAMCDGASDEAAQAPSKPSLEEACGLLAVEMGLTPRESEVLVLLARGRTLPIVSRDLHITKNTARSHIERVYQKTGIHKQQDLIDLVERWQRDKAR
ncbi:hypothetical protein B5F41_12350 [Gordonibacter sp. An232A]|nr:hypothetical protein B5F41_12350 [Gordonibacter sp. An232A]